MRRLPVTPTRLLIVLAALLLASLACSLSSGEQADVPTATSQPLILTPTFTPMYSPTPQIIIVTATSTPTNAAAPQRTLVPPTQINCSPQTNWPIYTVVAGDTLSQIATRTGSTTAQLAAANCLTNAGLIFVGQRLYVPVLPAVATATPTPNPNLPIFTANLTVKPFWLDAQSRAVTYSETVRVDAGEVLNASRVVFFVNDPYGGPAIQIGQDTDPYDGAFIDYDFPAPGSYTFQAIAQNETTQTSSTTFTIVYDPNFSPPGGQRNRLVISPYLRIDGGFYVLQAGSTVTISWPDAPVGALRVDFKLIPTGTGMGDQGQTIGSDLNPADGSLITWTPQAGILAHVEGFAAMPDGSTQTSEAAGVTAE